jgi:hypothetical protein
MPQGRFCTGPSRRRGDHLVMDIVAVLLGVLMFAVLIAVIYGIDRI